MNYNIGNFKTKLKILKQYKFQVKFNKKYAKQFQECINFFLLYKQVLI